MARRPPRRTEPIARLARALAGPLQVVACAALALATSLPWVWSGERGIDLYELRRVAHRIEADIDLRLLAPIAFVPLVLAASLLARWGGRRGLAWLLALAAALYTGAGVLAVADSNLTTGSGVPLAGAAAVVAVVGVVVEWVVGRVPSVPASAESSLRGAPQPE